MDLAMDNTTPNILPFSSEYGTYEWVFHCTSSSQYSGSRTAHLLNLPEWSLCTPSKPRLSLHKPRPTNTYLPQTSPLESGTFTDTYVTHPFLDYIPGGMTTIPVDMTTAPVDVTTIPNDSNMTTPSDMTALLGKLHVLLRIIYNLIQNRGTPPLTDWTQAIPRKRTSSFWVGKSCKCLWGSCKVQGGIPSAASCHPNARHL